MWEGEVGQQEHSLSGLGRARGYSHTALPAKGLPTSLLKGSLVHRRRSARKQHPLGKIVYS